MLTPELVLSSHPAPASENFTEEFPFHFSSPHRLTEILSHTYGVHISFPCDTLALHIPHSRTHRAGFPLPARYFPSLGTTCFLRLPTLTEEDSNFIDPLSSFILSVWFNVPAFGSLSSQRRRCLTPKDRPDPKVLRTLPAPVLRRSTCTAVPSPHSRLSYQGFSCLGRTRQHHAHPPYPGTSGRTLFFFHPSILAQKKSGLQRTRMWSTSGNTPRGPSIVLRTQNKTRPCSALPLERVHNFPAPTTHLALTLPPSRQRPSTRTSTSYLGVPLCFRATCFLFSTRAPL